MATTADRIVRFQLSVEQVKALSTLAEDQIFRVKHIDPKIPGYKNNLEQLRAGESALAVLKESLQNGHSPASSFHTPVTRRTS
jgi:hypothetical protein